MSREQDPVSFELSSSSLRDSPPDILYHIKTRTFDVPDAWASNLLKLDHSTCVTSYRDFYQRLQNPADLSDEEKKTHRANLLRALRDAAKIAYIRDEYLRDVDISCDEEIIEGLRKIQSGKFLIYNVIVEAITSLDEGNKTQEIKEKLDQKIRENKEKDSEKVSADISRTPLLVNYKGEGLLFRHISEFKEWVDSTNPPKLSKEQKEFASHFSSQSGICGLDYQILMSTREKIPELLDDIKYSPQFILSVSEDDHVSLSSVSTFKRKYVTDNGIVTDDSELIYSSTTADITDLKGTEFTPGMASNHVDWKMRYTITNNEKFGQIIPSFATPIDTNEHMNELGRRIIQSAISDPDDGGKRRTDPKEFEDYKLLGEKIETLLSDKIILNHLNRDFYTHNNPEYTENTRIEIINIIENYVDNPTPETTEDAPKDRTPEQSPEHRELSTSEAGDTDPSRVATSIRESLSKRPKQSILARAFNTARKMILNRSSGPSP